MDYTKLVADLRLYAGNARTTDDGITYGLYGLCRISADAIEALQRRIAELEAQLAHSNEMRADTACSAGTWKSIAEERLDYIAELESQLSAIRKAALDDDDPHAALDKVQAILTTINQQEGE